MKTQNPDIHEAYQSGELKTTQLYEAKQLLAKRRDQGPKANNRPKLPNSAHSLVKTYQREVERQYKMVLKAEHAQQKLLLVEQGLRTLFADTNFVTLLHHNFLLDGYSRNPSPGHPAARRHYNCFWGYKFPSNQKSNLIHIKLRQIEAGFTPVLPLEKLTLQKCVQDTGRKRALMLMLALPDRITDRYHEWAQNLCFIDQLLELKPDYSLLHELRDEYHAEFLKLYKSELRYAKQPEYGRRKDGEALAFYKKLFKFQYPVKRDIIRCLCEAKLNA